MNPFASFKTSVAQAIAIEEAVRWLVGTTDLAADDIREELARRCVLSSRPLADVIDGLKLDVAKGSWP